ncbi:MAG TPA: septal ring lytic transglycosylase RlpA family protein [Alphaproteobacteria bacterium]|nr:septal ring lytic transglycosylase RlpA family protein [Alphaproteobacteria bacterium]
MGTPYSIGGKVYYPAEVASYSEEGEASWYGPGFHGRQTANGEEFNANDMTAAHRTLPMPSVVRVTNMENGRTVVLRVNDRGPFARDRIIDVSKAASKALGFHTNGTTHVRVDFMPVESQIVAQAAQSGQILALNDVLNHTGGANVVSAPSGTVTVSSLDGTALPPSGSYQPVAYQTATDPQAAEHMGNVLREPASYNGGQVVTKTTTTIRNPVYIQAGAYASKQKAAEISRRLSSLGTTTVQETQRGGMKLFRVRVAAADKNAAQRIQSKMAGMGFTGSKIVNN